MIDGIINGDGTSRAIKATLPSTYEELRKACSNGTQLVDILFHEKGWAQKPDFLNKENLLQDSAAALFGLGANAVPNDVFALLGKYSQHWWRRRTPGQYVLDETIPLMQPNIVSWYGSAPDRTQTTYYYDSISINQQTGEVTPNGIIHSIDISYDTMSNANILKGKYFYKGQATSGTLYYTTESSSIQGDRGSSSSDTRVWITNCREAKTRKTSSVWEYVQSPDKNTYPDFGEQDGYEYEYLGVPYENSIIVPSIETGYYFGTGAHGKDYPNSITASKRIIAAFIAPNSSLKIADYNILYFGQGTSSPDNEAFSLSEDGKTLSWFSTDSLDYQLNAYGVKYFYILILI